MKLSKNEFYFDSDGLGNGPLCKRLTVTVNVYEAVAAAYPDFPYFDEEDVEIFDEESKQEVSLDKIPGEEKKRLLKEAQDLFESLAGPEHSEYLSCKAENEADRYEER